jgi:hypothetical protein
MVAGLTLHYQVRPPETETVVATLNDVDPDMVKSIDIIENFELIRDIDFYTDLEIIENPDESDARERWKNLSPQEKQQVQSSLDQWILEIGYCLLCGIWRLGFFN